MFWYKAGHEGAPSVFEEAKMQGTTAGAILNEVFFSKISAVFRDYKRKQLQLNPSVLTVDWRLSPHRSGWFIINISSLLVPQGPKASTEKEGGDCYVPGLCNTMCLKTAWGTIKESNVLVPKVISDLFYFCISCLFCLLFKLNSYLLKVQISISY